MGQMSAKTPVLVGVVVVGCGGGVGGGGVGGGGGGDEVMEGVERWCWRDCDIVG